MIIHNMEQGSPEWHEIKKGKMSASHAQPIGANGKGLNTYIMKLMAEYYSNGEKENYTNKNMERGLELENEASEIYSLKSGKELEKVGFVEHDNFVGCSPDRLIKGEKTGIEIKCPGDEVYFKLLVDGKIDTKYEWQILMCLLILGYEKWLYIVYNPNFKQDMVIIEVFPNEEKFEALRKGFKEGEKQIKQIKQRLDK